MQKTVWSAICLPVMAAEKEFELDVKRIIFAEERAHWDSDFAVTTGYVFKYDGSGPEGIAEDLWEEIVNACTFYKIPEEMYARYYRKLFPNVTIGVLKSILIYTMLAVVMAAMGAVEYLGYEKTMSGTMRRMSTFYGRYGIFGELLMYRKYPVVHPETFCKGLFNQIHRKFTISRLRHLYNTSNQTVAI